MPPVADLSTEDVAGAQSAPDQRLTPLRSDLRRGRRQPEDDSDGLVESAPLLL